MEETQALGRKALTEWLVAARATGEARRRAERKDALFVKVGAWLEELRADKALSPSPEADRLSPAGREARRAQYKERAGHAPSPAPAPRRASPLAKDADQSDATPARSDLVTPPRAFAPPAPTLRESLVGAWLAADDVATPPGARPDEWLDLDDTPPNVEKMLARDADASPARGSNRTAETRGKENRDAGFGRRTTKTMTRTTTTTKTRTTVVVGNRGGVASPALSEMNFFDDGAADDSPELASVTKSAPRRGRRAAGGISAGTRARLERLSAKQRGRGASSKIHAAGA